MESSGKTGEKSQRTWPPVPRIWSGEGAVIVGSGPGVSREQVERIRGKLRVIVVNNSHELAPWADLLYACDWGWWNKYNPTFNGLRVSQDAKSVEFFGVKRIPSENKPGLSLDPFKIHQGANGGYQALNLAVLLGVKTVFLLGFDMRSVDGKKHWHGDHPNGLNNPTDDTYRMWINAFNTTIGDLKTAGVEVINCTHDSALRCFRFGRIEDFL